MLMSTPTTLADLTARTGLDVLAHVERETAIPVLAGLQAQGDLIVVPWRLLADVTVPSTARWQEVPPAGAELLRGAGGNPHTLVADPGTCQWTRMVEDPEGLALAVVENTAIVHLVHPEHGGSGIAPGRYVVRRQREGGTAAGLRGHRLIAD